MKYLLFIFLYISLTINAEAETASWYSVESCKREGTWQKYGGKTASGEVFDDRKYTCASWFYEFGTKVRVSSCLNNKSVICEVTDRGPAKRLVKKGRIIDLSKAAFSAIASLEQGVIPIKVEVISKRRKDL